ncbi:hypothetical protein MNBD_GAMMA08-3083 [hydrothermal vent metagenome]|uniref:PDZ domain-containing protein n=1 Tax=hydrothermal vent metagenome TaxID=652676 RepID=A0A3B0Y650_9ZZZZ
MKAHITTVIIALIMGYLGGYFSHNSQTIIDADTQQQTPEDNNNFQASTEEDLIYLVDTLQYKIENLQIQINALEKKQQQINHSEQSLSGNSNQKKPNVNARVVLNKKDLVSAGINSDIADDLLRRSSHQNFRRLELQNLMRRATPALRKQYTAELRELNKNKISLRTEIGDNVYDQYLFTSNQNNRVKVSSVMSGSPAEASGFQIDDIILYYDNKKVLNWADLRTATTQGDIGVYTSVEILRDGAQMSLMVPSGTLGVQLNAVQVDPSQ